MRAPMDRYAGLQDGKPHNKKEKHMGIGDKIGNAAEDLGGKAKESYGKATGDDEKVAEGKGDQASASAKKVGEDVKDVFKH